MVRVVNAYTVSPSNIQPGDVMLFIVKAMVVREGAYRIYRCPFDWSVDPRSTARFAVPLGTPLESLPQGSRILNERKVCEALFPSLAAVAEPDAL